MKQKEDKKKPSNCQQCGNNINLKSDKYVQLSTFKSGESIEQNIWHFDCWVEYINTAITKRAKGQVSQMQEKCLTLFNSPMIKDVLSQVQGTDQLLSMLKTPLTTINVDKLTKVSEKIENGRKQRGKVKKKKRRQF